MAAGSDDRDLVRRRKIRYGTVPGSYEPPVEIPDAHVPEWSEPPDGNEDSEFGMPPGRATLYTGIAPSSYGSAVSES